MSPLLGHHLEPQHVPVLLAMLAAGFFIGWSRSEAVDLASRTFAQVTVAGQRRTCTGFAFMPWHPGRKAPLPIGSVYCGQGRAEGPEDFAENSPHDWACT